MAAKTRYLEEFIFFSFFSPNVPCDSLTLPNGLEYLKAKIKLNAFNSQYHSDEEIAHRLRQIDTDFRHVEEALRNDLSFRRQLRPSPPSRSSLSHIASNRHATGTRIGLMDSTVPGEAMVSGVE